MDRNSELESLRTQLAAFEAARDILLERLKAADALSYAASATMKLFDIHSDGLTAAIKAYESLKGGEE